MIVPQDWEFDYDENIPEDQYQVLLKFLNYYKNSDLIVADKYRLNSKIVSFEETDAAFIPYGESGVWKNLDFQKKIAQNGKKYVVRLGLWRTNPQEDDPKCLSISDFEILTPGKRHVLTLSTNDIRKKKIFYNIIDIFNEEKIISPEAAYGKRMYPNKALQGFINNHDWGKIIEGINQAPRLANALFPIGEPYTGNHVFSVYLGTILYQLIAYRNEHINEFTNKDLLELDKTILELSKTELLKVKLLDSTGNSKMWPTGSVLLECISTGSQMRISEQFTVGNGELQNEQKTLNKVIRQFKNR